MCIASDFIHNINQRGLALPGCFPTPMRVRMKYLATILLLAFLTVPASGQALTRVEAGIEPLQQGAVALGDLDGDGRLDVLMSGYDARGTAVTRLYQNGGVTNARLQFDVVGEGLPVRDVFTSLDLGDYDNDGDLDVLATGPFSSDVYRNDGDFRFVPLQLDLPSMTVAGGIQELINTASSAWGDYDSDGDLDILLTGSDPDDTPSGKTSLVYRNDGDGLFTAVDVGLPDMRGGSVDWGDFNADGRLDILATHQPGPSGQSFTKIFRNDGDTFTDVQAQLPGTDNLNYESGSARWGDVDNDGRLDVLFTADALYEASTTAVGVYRNAGGGTFVDMQDALPSAFFADWMDLDGDGYRDVVLNRTEPQSGKTSATNTFLKIFRNESGQFSEAENVPGIWDGAIAIGDLDNDRRPDVLITGAEENDFRASALTATVYKNTSRPSANQPPTTPTHLRSFRNETSATTMDLVLEWDAAVDPDGEDAALTYNVRVGTSPGASDVLSAMAREDGTRLVPAPGNAGPLHRLVLRNLDASKSYFWAVQAVDASLAGSPFVSEDDNLSVDTEDTRTDVPQRVELLGNHPNPFNPSTTIRYALPEQAPVRLTVYNVLGAEVAVLVDRTLPAGQHQVQWRGRNALGQLVPSGLYIYRLETPGQTLSRKMVLLK